MKDLLPGGLSTSFSTLKANLLLSVTVAITGICLPIGLSYSLLHLVNATPLQAFAAGAALCSTSLGTTFTVLKTSALTKSRLGVVLTSAAMMDDVVGLVMVQIISNLSPGDTKFGATTVIRPIFVSLAFATIVPLLCRFIVLPGSRYLESSKVLKVCKHVLHRRPTPLLFHTGILLALVTGASYAGTSNLFAAYLAGAVISWWDTVTEPIAGEPNPSPPVAPETTSKIKPREECTITAQENKDRALQPETNYETPPEGPPILDVISSATIPNQELRLASKRISTATQTCPETTVNTPHETSRTGLAVYEHYYLPVVDRILKPLFFVSLNR